MSTPRLAAVTLLALSLSTACLGSSDSRSEPITRTADALAYAPNESNHADARLASDTSGTTTDSEQTPETSDTTERPTDAPEDTDEGPKPEPDTSEDDEPVGDGEPIVDAGTDTGSTPDTTPTNPCTNGLTECSGQCVDTQTTLDHCGTCGNSCARGQTCERGQCKEIGKVAGIVHYTNVARSTSTDCGSAGTFPAAPPLTANPELHAAAQTHADRMADFGFFAHDDPHDGSNFVDRIRRTNYQGFPVGENIAAGGSTAEGVVQRWLDSDGHCRNIMNPDATQIGVGYRYESSSRYRTFWVQVFGR